MKFRKQKKGRRRAGRGKKRGLRGLKTGREQNEKEARRQGK